MAAEQEVSAAVRLMQERNSLMTTEKSIKVGRSFKPRPSDVFIVTYPKCGTTWVTQICHSLRSEGDMSFGEICEVVPWDVLAYDCKQDLDAEQTAEPRLFKSHEPYEVVAKNVDAPAKYIHVARDPYDAFVSFYHFLPNYMGIPDGEISLEEFCDSIFAGVSNHGQIWNFYVSYLKAMESVADRVLWVFYEDLKRDLPKEIKRIAAFMEIPLTKEFLDKVAHQASFEFMSEHHSKFDDHFVFGMCKTRMGMVEDPNFKRKGKVRKDGGTVGSKAILPESIKQRLKDKWEAIVTAETGFATYEALKEAVKARAGRQENGKKVE